MVKKVTGNYEQVHVSLSSQTNQKLKTITGPVTGSYQMNIRGMEHTQWPSPVINHEKTPRP